MSQDFADGFAVTVAAQNGTWVVRPFDDPFDTLDTAISAVRGLRNEGAAFAMLDVEEEYAVIVRPGPSGVRVLISDATMAVDDDFAAEVLDTAGIDVPDIDPGDLDDVDGWADGDFGILADLGLSEQLAEVLIDSGDDPSDIIERIADELGFADALADCLE
ncbi:hypothetical protein CAPI_00430 [Corynebacterium capitovis DSM 44611]|uniref:tRNA adenosine deaminase-associated protein n=1 Tax=Corynebacterium capitovis TaxID=131081 RepID=UPI000372E6F3|nr:tRNA adenosine deaminase-associated protein [Corynebacterium capitovis]WKD56669.1 hypothetical protein CAPI_00430 [Corynebacterium capitovis DSM 44611]